MNNIDNLEMHVSLLNMGWSSIVVFYIGILVLEFVHINLIGFQVFEIVK
jgi:hypothetical protein